jgi:hypothetical protein
MTTEHNGTGSNSASRSASHSRAAAPWHFGQCRLAQVMGNAHYLPRSALSEVFGRGSAGPSRLLAMATRWPPRPNPHLPPAAPGCAAVSDATSSAWSHWDAVLSAHLRDRWGPFFTSGLVTRLSRYRGGYIASEYCRVAVESERRANIPIAHLRCARWLLI